MAIILMIYFSVKNAQMTARLAQALQNAHHAMMDIIMIKTNAYNVHQQGIAKLAEKKEVINIAHLAQTMPI